MGGMDALSILQAKLDRVKVERAAEAEEEPAEPEDVVLEQRVRRKKKKKKKKDKGGDTEEFTAPPLFQDEEVYEQTYVEPEEPVVREEAHSLPLTADDIDPFMDIDEIS